MFTDFSFFIAKINYTLPKANAPRNSSDGGSDHMSEPLSYLQGLNTFLKLKKKQLVPFYVVYAIYDNSFMSFNKIRESSAILADDEERYCFVWEDARRWTHHFCSERSQ